MTCLRCAHPAIALYRVEDAAGALLAYVCFGCILRARDAAESASLDMRLARYFGQPAHALHVLPIPGCASCEPLP